MPVYDKYNFLLLPKMLVLNPKDGYSSTKCPMCQRQQKIDAIVSSYGYSAL